MQTSFILLLVVLALLVAALIAVVVYEKAKVDSLHEQVDELQERDKDVSYVYPSSAWAHYPRRINYWWWRNPTKRRRD